MQSNILEAKSVVLVSTTEIEAQITRLQNAIPELRRLRRSLAPNDPRAAVVREALRSAKIAEAWLSEAVGNV